MLRCFNKAQLLASAARRCQLPVVRISHSLQAPTKNCKRLISCSVSSATMQQPAPHIYSMGPGTLEIDRKAFHGGTRSKFLEAFRNSGHNTGVVLIQGGGPFHVYSTDGELVFKQEAYMHYLFGVTEDSWYGAIDTATGKSYLFMPRLPDAYAVWMGRLKTTEEYKAIYAVDEVHYVDEMTDTLKQIVMSSQGTQQHPLYVLSGANTDSGLPLPAVKFEGIDQFILDTTSMFDVLTECRVTKTSEEIAVQRYANKIGSAGHVAIMQAAQLGMMEYQLESLFLHTCYSSGGCRLAGYTPISASGPNGAVLHYGHAGAPNDRLMQSGDMLLADMGCEYYRYTSDITCTWPVTGKFTQQQALIYNAVLDAHTAVIKAMKPGVAWPDMHTLAYRTILSALQSGGLVRGNLDDMMAADVGALLMPHGLGHFLGIDTHDVGGYPAAGPARIQRPGYKSLRTARELEPGMVITVEPGCYFNEALLLPAFQDPVKSQFLVQEAIEPYLNFGGVRIEDNVVVTADGAESLTHVPRTVEEIEAVMAGAPWPTVQ